MTALSPGKQWGLRRMADAQGFFMMTAVDQRPPIKGPIAAHYGTDEAPYDDVAAVKALLTEVLQDASTAMLLDPHFAIPRGLPCLSPGKGLIVTLEDSVFAETPGGRLSAEIDAWSVGKIKRLGGDAVKVLAWYRPDADPKVCAHQQEFVKRVGAACAKFDIPFLFELLVYPLASDSEKTGNYEEMASKRADHVLRSVEVFAAPEFGVDVFKLESPIAAKDVPAAGDAATQALFDEMGRLAGRPWVMLSAGAGKPEFQRILEYACAAGASGYLAGRAIWAEAFRQFPDLQAMRDGLVAESLPYMHRLNAIVQAAGTPWHAHPAFNGKALAFSPADGSFRQGYEDL
ncbi:MAG: tagatose 1,6-diphosphate aldolase [Pseudomonadota bacterium]